MWYLGCNRAPYPSLLKLLPEENRSLANKMNILGEQCTWANEFYSSSGTFPKQKICDKRLFSINTATTFREIGQVYKG